MWSATQRHYPRTTSDRVSKKIGLVLLLYVDDILYCGQPHLLKKFESAIQSRYKIKTRDTVIEFNGIQFASTPLSILIYQQEHIMNAITKFDLVDASIPDTPLEGGTLVVGKQPKLKDTRLFQSLVGILNYVSQCSHLDVAFATAYLSSHLKELTLSHSKKQSEYSVIYVAQLRIV